MNEFNPMYIPDILEKRPGTVVTAQDWNAAMSLFRTQGNNNTSTLAELSTSISELSETVYDLETNKMDKVNPTGTGAFSLNREPGSTIGLYSFAEGEHTIASGGHSHAEGDSTKATGHSAHAEGYHTTASGIYSHAEGISTVAAIAYTHAEGGHTEASGNAAHAEGWSTNASGASAHAEGEHTEATGDWSHSEGYYTTAASKFQHVAGKFNLSDTNEVYARITGNGPDINHRSNAETLDWLGNLWVAGSVTDGNGNVLSDMTAKMDKNNPTGTGSFSLNRRSGSTVGYNSFAEGNGNTASGSSSHAEGDDTTASGDYSHAEGSHTNATFIYSHAEGCLSEASGNASHAEGNHTVASGTYAHAEGGWSEATANTAHAEGDNTRATGQSAHTEGANTAASSYASHAEGSSTEASGNSSHAEGNATKATNYYAHAEGWNTKATEYAAHSEGRNTTASGMYSHAEGFTATASGDMSHAEGSITRATGQNSHAEGGTTRASGEYAHAEGEGSEASGSRSHAEGRHTIASGSSQHVAGEYNVEDTDNIYARITGNGTSDNRSNAETLDWLGNLWVAGNITDGNGNVLSDMTAKMNKANPTGTGALSINRKANTTVGDFSVAVGFDTEASGYQAFAEGEETQALGDNAHTMGFGTIAVGEDSIATGASTVAVGSKSQAEGEGTYTSYLTNDVVIHIDSVNATDHTADCTLINNSSDPDTTVYERFMLGRYVIVGSSHYYVIKGRWQTLADSTYHIRLYSPTYPIGATPADLSDYQLKDITGIAFGDYSHVSGLDNQALGKASYVIGSQNKADIAADYSFVSGIGNTAHVSAATVLGEYNHAYGEASIASGYQSNANNVGTIVHGWRCSSSGQYSIALGKQAIATGNLSLAQGELVKAYGATAAAFNCDNIARGSTSFAIGWQNEAKGVQSFVQGHGTIAHGANQSALGAYNVEDTSDDYALVVGNGTNNSNRHNAFTVGWNGNITASGEVTDGNGNILSGKQATLVSGTNIKTINNQSILGSGNIDIQGGGGGGIDKMDKVNPTGTGYVQLGTGASASSQYGTDSFAIGTDAKAYGMGSFVIGKGSQTYEGGQVIFGPYNADDSTAELIIACGEDSNNRKNLLTFESGTDDAHFAAEVVDGDGNILSSKLDNLVVLEYGVSTWADFTAALQKNAVIFCKVGTGVNPAQGGKPRYAFLAYIEGTAANPSNAEFQYFRSLSNHSYDAQGDEVYVYKLFSDNGWTVSKRTSYTKIVNGSGLNRAYSNGVLTLSVDPTILANKLDIPTLPATDGTYTLQLTLTNGTASYAWI